MKFPRERPTRADATRNREAIIDASLTTLNVSPRASMGEIAAAAGVSRSTLYSHFASRQTLVVTTLNRMLSHANAQFAALDPTLSPENAVAALVGTSWKLLGQFHGVSAAAVGHVSPQELRRLHDEPADHIRRLLARGRDDGSFRIDQDLSWQVECVYAISRAGAALLKTARSAQVDPSAEVVTSLRAVLAAVPGESGTDAPEPHPRQADQP